MVNIVLTPAHFPVRPGIVLRTSAAFLAASRTRFDHITMDGIEVNGMDTPVVLPDGSRMAYPGDTSLGAGAVKNMWWIGYGVRRPTAQTITAAIKAARPPWNSIIWFCKSPMLKTVSAP